MLSNPKKPLTDIPYILFLIALALFGIIFVQYFSTVPIFYKDVYHMSEDQIGLVLAMNGALIVIFEMPLIAWMEKKNFSNIKNTVVGLLMTGISFLFLLWESWIGVVIIGMVIATFGEMISFPFSNKFALNRSKLGRQGAYMGLYSMAFSVAHIFGHNSGMQVVDNFGFNNTWFFLLSLTAIAWVLLYIVKKMLQKEQEEPVSLSIK